MAVYGLGVDGWTTADDRPRRLLDEVREGLIDPVIQRDAVLAAADAALDGPSPDPLVVFQAMRTAIPAAIVSYPDDPRCAASEFATLLARAEYRLGYPRRSFETAYKTLFRLSQQAGGMTALENALASRSREPLAGVSVAALAVCGEALAPSGLTGAARERVLDDGRRLLRAYLRRGGSPVVYGRTHALVRPWLALLTSGDAVDDRALAACLRRLMLSANAERRATPLMLPAATPAWPVARSAAV